VEEGQGVAVVGDGEGDVGVGSQDDGYVHLAAEVQDVQVIGRGHVLVAQGYHAGRVDFQQGMGLCGGADDGFEVHLCRAVARVADDVCPRAVYGGEHGLGVLRARAALPAEAVYAGDAQVAAAVMCLVEIQSAGGVKNIQLHAHEEAHAIHLARHHVQVAEIDGSTGSGQAGRVLGDAEDLQSLVGGSLRHLLNGGIGMSGGDRVCVEVKKWGHGLVVFAAKLHVFYTMTKIIAVFVVILSRI